MLSKKLILAIFFAFKIGLSFPDAAKVEKIDRLLNIYADEELFSGVVLVSHKENIIYKKAFGIANRGWNISMTTDTKFKIGSVSKPFTALIIMQLIEAGDLSLNTRIANYLPDYMGPGKDQITIEQLLSHSSGLLNCLPPDQEMIQERLYHSLEDLLRYFDGSNLYFEPGSTFHYSNLAYSMLALIAERVTQISFDRLLYENIFKPAGMADSNQDVGMQVEKHMATGYEYDLLNGYENTSFIDMSYAVGSGGIISSADDLHKFYRALFSNSLLSEELKEAMYTQSKQGPYGYGWFIRNMVENNTNDALKVVEHSGSINGFGSYLGLIPSDSLLVVVLKNSRSHNYIRPVFSPVLGKDIISILYGGEFNIPKKSIAMHLGRIIGNQDIDHALETYDSLKKKNNKEYEFDESELNKLGIELLFKYKRINDALKIFELNMNEFPKSYNTYDSYAYTLNQKGDYPNSIYWYKKGFAVLEKYPDYNNSVSVEKDVVNAQKLILEMQEKLKIDSSK